MMKFSSDRIPRLGPEHTQRWGEALGSSGRQIVVFEGAGHPVDLVGGEAVLDCHVAPGSHHIADIFGDGAGFGLVQPEVAGQAERRVERDVLVGLVQGEAWTLGFTSTVKRGAGP